MLLALLLIVFTFSACAKQPEQKPQQNAPQTTPNTEGQKVNVVGAVYDQWKGSGHSKAVEADNPAEAPGMNEKGKCFKCHNGYAFELNADSLKGIGILKGASCDTCHVGYAQKLLAAGNVQVPIGNIKGGKGTLCIACHNGRGKKPDQKSAPHGSVQADMLFSKSGAQVEGFKYGQHGHGKTEDTCLSCHMAKDKNGIKDHTFKMNVANIANSCGKCHKNITSFNPEAKADYDGDGSKKGIQDEVSGLNKMLEAEILKKLNGGKFISKGGKVVFQDASGKALETPPDEKVYNAAWNYFFVRNDGSKGIHNPTYAIQLLQQSYKNLTGKDVPNAEIRK